MNIGQCIAMGFGIFMVAGTLFFILAAMKRHEEYLLWRVRRPNPFMYGVDNWEHFENALALWKTQRP